MAQLKFINYHRSGQGSPQGHQYWGILVPLWDGTHCFKVRSQVFLEEDFERSFKISMHWWKLFYLLILVWMKSLLQQEYLFWPLFFTSQYFCEYKILESCKFLVFCKNKLDLKYKIKIWFPDFLMYCNIKSFLFAEINQNEISETLHLPKLIQTKIWWC